MKVTKKQVTLTTVVITAALMLGTYAAVKYNATEKEATPVELKKDIPMIKEEPVKEVPKKEKKKPILQQDIRTIAKYIQSRNSRIPSEVAELEAEFIVTVSARNNMNVALINGIIEKESLYDPTSVSKASAKGLMQILKGEVDIDPDKAHNIEYNIQTGITILQEKLKKSNNNLTSSLNSYSGGAKNYASAVYECIGRFTMFRESEDKENAFAMVD